MLLYSVIYQVADLVVEASLAPCLEDLAHRVPESDHWVIEESMAVERSLGERRPRMLARSETALEASVMVRKLAKRSAADVSGEASRSSGIEGNDRIRRGPPPLL